MILGCSKGWHLSSSNAFRSRAPIKIRIGTSRWNLFRSTSRWHLFSLSKKLDGISSFWEPTSFVCILDCFSRCDIHLWSNTEFVSKFYTCPCACKVKQNIVCNDPVRAKFKAMALLTGGTVFFTGGTVILTALALGSSLKHIFACVYTLTNDELGNLIDIVDWWYFHYH